MHVQALAGCGKVDVVHVCTKIVVMKHIVRSMVRHELESFLVFFFIMIVNEKIVGLPKLVNV